MGSEKNHILWVHIAFVCFKTSLANPEDQEILVVKKSYSPLKHQRIPNTSLRRPKTSAESGQGGRKTKELRRKECGYVNGSQAQHEPLK